MCRYDEETAARQTQKQQGNEKAAARGGFHGKQTNETRDERSSLD